MKDTPEHLDELMRSMLMTRSGEERIKMGCSMFDAAKTMARASLAHLPEQDVLVQLFERFYGSDFDESTRALIIARIIEDCAHNTSTP